MEYKIEMIPIVNLKPAAYNPRKISDHEFKKLLSSIEHHGILENLIVNKDMTVIAGHQRLKAAECLGIEFVPCLVVDVPEGVAKVMNVQLNRLGGEFDQALLVALLNEMDAEERWKTGFDDDELVTILQGKVEKKEGEESAATIERFRLTIMFPSEDAKALALDDVKMVAEQYNGIVSE